MHRNLRIALLLSIAASAAVDVAAQRDELGRGQTETEQFFRLYPSRAKTFIKASSDPDDLPTAPSRGNDDGFTGLNGTEAFRSLVFGQDVAVLADVAGRSGFIGCIFRNYWSGFSGDPVYPQELNRAILRVDGTALVDRELSSFFRNEGSGQLPPFTGPFTGNRAGAHLTHTPIPFDDTLDLIVFENAFDNAGRFHKVAGTYDPPEGSVRIPDLIEWEEVARRRLWAPSAAQPTRAEWWPHAVPPAWQLTALNIPTGGAASVALTGPQTILGLECEVGNPAMWQDLWAVFTFDGAATPDVEVPLRMLGNMSRRPFSAPMSGLLFGNDGARTVTSFFPMPFLQNADLRIEHRGTGAAAQVNVRVSTERGRPRSPWGYFTATWQRGLTQTGVPFLGPSYPGRRGMLRHIALESWMELSNRIPNQTEEHLEGDLCVRINGNRGDDHTFAASETSIGKWGWYLTLSDVPFVEDSSFHTGITLAPVGGVMQSNRVQGSTFVFDPIHFVDGIEIVLEHGPQNQANAEYGLFCVFYLERGGPARTQIMELDVGDVAAETAANVAFSEVQNYSLTSEFFRDPFFGTPPVTDTVREIQTSYAFDVTVPNPSLYPTGYAIGVRLDRQRNPGVTTRAQAEVYVDGQYAGLVHAWTSNPTFRWKEGGELEVELPRALTDGKTQFRVELRPRANTDPFNLARAWVYGYTRN